MGWNRLAEALILVVLAVPLVQAVQSKEEPVELKGKITKIQGNVFGQMVALFYMFNI